MTDQPLGTPTPDTTTPLVREPSIVDTILNLDEFLSGDVRLAEKTARFCTRPDIEAEIDQLEAELAELVDETGRPLPGSADDSLGGDDGRGQALEKALAIQTKRQEMADATRSVRMRQLSDEKWQAFKVKHREAFATTDRTSQRAAMLDELVTASAIAPTIDAKQLAQLRGRVGAPQIDELIAIAWEVNTQSGVSVPKSLRSSAALKRLAPGQS